MIIMCIGDCHIPFQHKDSFAFIKAVKEQFNPDLVVCLGDLVDQYTISKYGKSTNSAAAVEELGATRKAIKELSSIIPEMTITLGNHTARYLKRIEEIGIPEEFMKSLNQIYEAPETWEWKEERNEPTFGVLAQEVQQVIPEAVIQHPDGYLMVDYAHPELQGVH